MGAKYFFPSLVNNYEIFVFNSKPEFCFHKCYICLISNFYNIEGCKICFTSLVNNYEIFVFKLKKNNRAAGLELLILKSANYAV